MSYLYRKEDNVDFEVQNVNDIVLEVIDVEQDVAVGKNKKVAFSGGFEYLFVNYCVYDIFIMSFVIRKLHIKGEKNEVVMGYHVEIKSSIDLKLKNRTEPNKFDLL